MPGVWLTAVLLFLNGVPTGLFNVQFFSLLQSAVDDAYLGRVTSLITSLAMLLTPVGALLGGTVASAVGTRFVLYTPGVTSIATAVYYLASPQLRALPSVAEADEAALGLRSTNEDTPESVGASGGLGSE